jgi:hypothetical protein
MRAILRNGTSRRGFEHEYGLAWKHRIVSMKLLNEVPWWQWRRRRRLWRSWESAMDRIREYGRDVELS